MAVKYSEEGVNRCIMVDSDEVLEYYVSGDKLLVVYIPVGYIHTIENLVDCDR